MPKMNRIKKVLMTAFFAAALTGLVAVIYYSILVEKKPPPPVNQETVTSNTHCIEWRSETAYKQRILNNLTAIKTGTYCVDFGDNVVTNNLEEARWVTYRIDIDNGNELVSSYGNQEPFIWDMDNLDIVLIPRFEDKFIGLVEVSESASNVYFKLSILMANNKGGVIVTDVVHNPISKYQTSQRKGSASEIDGFYEGRSGEVLLDVLMPDEGNAGRCSACAEYHVVTKQLVDGVFTDIGTRPYDINHYSKESY